MELPDWVGRAAAALDVGVGGLLEGLDVEEGTGVREEEGETGAAAEEEVAEGVML